MGQMVSIEVDNEVFQYLQQHAEPLRDTPNSVLRRLLGLEDHSQLTPLPAGDPKPRKRSRKELSPARLAVIAALQKHPDASADVLAKAAGIGISTCGNILREFHRDGTAIRTSKPSVRGIAYQWRLAAGKGRAGASADRTADSAESNNSSGKLSTDVDYFDGTSTDED